MLEEAIAFATKAHDGQFRKGTDRPYIVHPMEVTDIVSQMTTDEEVLSAAVLHDTIEDCPDVTEEVLREQFGDRVASLVAGESEDKTEGWQKRKEGTILRLESAPREIQMIGLADKLSNMRDIDRDYPVVGDELWLRFRMKDKQVLGWYYRSIRDVLQDDFAGVGPFEEYKGLVNQYFGTEKASVSWRENWNEP